MESWQKTSWYFQLLESWLSLPGVSYDIHFEFLFIVTCIKKMPHSRVWCGVLCHFQRTCKIVSSIGTSVWVLWKWQHTVTCKNVSLTTNHNLYCFWRTHRRTKPFIGSAPHHKKDSKGGNSLKLWIFGFPQEFPIDGLISAGLCFPVIVFPWSRLLHCSVNQCSSNLQDCDLWRLQ